MAITAGALAAGALAAGTLAAGASVCRDDRTGRAGRTGAALEIGSDCFTVFAAGAGRSTGWVFATAGRARERLVAGRARCVEIVLLGAFAAEGRTGIAAGTAASTVTISISGLGVVSTSRGGAGTGGSADLASGAGAISVGGVMIGCVNSTGVTR